jgi:hypothetical protein
MGDWRFYIEIEMGFLQLGRVVRNRFHVSNIVELVEREWDWNGQARMLKN